MINLDIDMHLAYLGVVSQLAEAKSTLWSIKIFLYNALMNVYMPIEVFIYVWNQLYHIPTNDMYYAYSFF